MNRVYLILTFIVLAVIQLTVIPFFTFGSFHPDLISVFVTVFAVLYGRVSGMIGGFLAGLLLDLMSGGIIGLSSFSKTINGFVAGSFSPGDKKDGLSKVKLFFIILLCSTMDSFFYTFLSGSFVSIGFFELVLYHGILPGLYTAIIGSPVLIVIERLK